MLLLTDQSHRQQQQQQQQPPPTTAAVVAYTNQHTLGLTGTLPDSLSALTNLTFMGFDLVRAFVVCFVVLLCLAAARSLP